MIRIAEEKIARFTTHRGQARQGRCSFCAVISSTLEIFVANGLEFISCSRFPSFSQMSILAQADGTRRIFHGRCIRRARADKKVVPQRAVLQPTGVSVCASVARWRRLGSFSSSDDDNCCVSCLSALKHTFFLSSTAHCFHHYSFLQSCFVWNTCILY